MCPDPNLLSVYMDDELPSPWKEKMESHLTLCVSCREKLDGFKLLLKESNDTDQETQAAKERVWENLQQVSQGQSRQSFRSGNNFSGNNFARLLQRRLSIPLPAAAAAAILVILMAALFFHNGQQGNSGLAHQQSDNMERTGFFLAAEEEMPGIMPAADINSVLQFLTSDGAEVIILRLPENTSFSRTGEPAIVRAADYRRYP